MPAHTTYSNVMKLQAAKRAVVNLLGKSMEFWMVGQVPIGLANVATQDNVKVFPITNYEHSQDVNFSLFNIAM